MTKKDAENRMNLDFILEKGKEICLMFIFATFLSVPFILFFYFWVLFLLFLDHVCADQNVKPIKEIATDSLVLFKLSFSLQYFLKSKDPNGLSVEDVKAFLTLRLKSVKEQRRTPSGTALPVICYKPIMTSVPTRSS